MGGVEQFAEFSPDGRSEEVDDFSVGPDGGTVVYRVRPRRSAELDLLTTREAMKAMGGR